MTPSKRVEVIELKQFDVFQSPDLVQGYTDDDDPGITVIHWGEKPDSEPDNTDQSREDAKFFVEWISQYHSSRQYHCEGGHWAHVWARRLKPDGSYDPYGELILIFAGGMFTFGEPPESDFPSVELVGLLDSMRQKAQPLIQ